MSAGVPRATYRLQFSAAFRFDDGRRLVPYLAALGVSHVYASPILMARPGSAHGYDIVDHGRLNPEIGSRREFDAFVAALRAHGMGLIVDFVPNHMGIGPDNPWWMDVLEWGRSSPFAGYFDIDWQPAEPTLTGKVLLPVLGDHYGAVLERGELALAFDGESGSFRVAYFDTPFPIAPRSYASLLQSAARRAGDGAPLESLAADFRRALTGGAGRMGQKRRRERIAELKRALARVAAGDAAVNTALGGMLEDLNGTPGRAETFDELHRLLEAQAYRLAFWRVAAHEMNYRRFFDINDLAGLRMEQPALFEAAHALIARLIADGSIEGLRLDHVDGLRDPRRYVAQLRSLAAASRPGAVDALAPRAARARPLYVVVEKILAAHERLRADWQVSGTSGYDFMATLNALFVDPAAERPLTRVYERFIGHPADFEAICVDARRLIMQESLGSELNVLANLFNRLAKRHRATRDYSATALKQALTEVVAHFPVYRTYVTARRTAAEDRRDLEWAVARARRSVPRSDTSIFDFLLDVLTLDLLHEPTSRARRRGAIDAALKFQQYTGPVMAKAVEDTAFYRYVRFASLNEVGGDPGRFALSPAAFHETNRRRLAGHPASLLATATHDHKRGEDVRARLNVLSEMPSEWSRRVRRWSVLNRRKRRPADAAAAPSRNDEYLFYQTVVGAWPPTLTSSDDEALDTFRERIGDYMRKASREARLRTSWASPNDAYEEALSRFVAEVLDPKLSRPFLDDVCAFAHAIAPAGAVNGLAQTVLKLTSPGVPDFYQGTELWDFSLVDPDNRRAVDFDSRRRGLAALGDAAPASLLASWRDGRIKQSVVHNVLALRARQPALFASARYRPLDVAGCQAERVVAFSRVADDGGLLLAAVPRLVSPMIASGRDPLPAGWDDTEVELPPELRGRTFVDVLTGRGLECTGTALEAAALFAELPAAVLTADPAGRLAA